MIRFFSFFLFLAFLFPATAQTLRIHSGPLTTAFRAEVGEMPLTDGASLTIGNQTFLLSEIDSITTDRTTMTDNSVTVVYDGSSAHVVVAANVAPWLTVSVNGAHVSIVQDTELPSEVTYTLQGTATDGSFWMDGKLKASLIMKGLNLTCKDSAAVNIRCGKHISLTLADGTENFLTDGATGSQKGCFMVKGHTEVKGGGLLQLTGNAAHGFWGGEYLELKKTTGTIIVAKATKDGLNVNQYVNIKGGTLQVLSAGDDGIQVTRTDNTTDELNGQFLMSGGSVSLLCAANAAKGIKCEDSLKVSGGTIDITMTGGGLYSSTDADVSAACGIKVDGAATFDGGNVTILSSGAGGKGINCTGDLTINSGTFSINTKGKQYAYNRLTSSPKGIRSEGVLMVNGGSLNVSCSGGEGSEGIESKKELYITDGDLIVQTYDDALNATNKISISGGRIYAYASNNDGIDSNGTLSISGGLVMATGANQPEEGFDCDQNTFAITGGTLIGLGGSTSTPTSSVTTQPVAVVSNKSLTQGQYLVLKASDGTVIWSYLIPRTYSQATLLVSSPQLSVGNSYTLTTGATVTGGNAWQGYATDSTVSSGSTLQSLTLSQMVTSSGSSSGGGPGGGGGGPGGGGGRPGGW